MQPTTPIWGVRHAAIRVRDLEAAKTWYRDVLGMTVEDEFAGRGIFVRFGPYYHHDLAIFQADAAAPAPAPNSVGLMHIALLVDSLRGVREWYHHLKAKGVEVRGSDHGVTRSIYFTDPDGNPFEIYCDNPDFDWRKDGLTMIEPLDVGEGA
ncbi:MAG TPA: VOC family protein [Dehalococcoidia bacterium]|nr:VOC family protein [Dehalococcoidia bacterium]